MLSRVVQSVEFLSIRKFWHIRHNMTNRLFSTKEYETVKVGLKQNILKQLNINIQLDNSNEKKYVQDIVEEKRSSAKNAMKVINDLIEEQKLESDKIETFKNINIRMQQYKSYLDTNYLIRRMLHDYVKDSCIVIDKKFDECCKDIKILTELGVPVDNIIILKKNKTILNIIPEDVQGPIFFCCFGAGFLSGIYDCNYAIEALFRGITTGFFSLFGIEGINNLYSMFYKHFYPKLYVQNIILEYGFIKDIEKNKLNNIDTSI